MHSAPMKPARMMTATALSLLLSIGARAQTAPIAGETHILTKSYSTTDESSDGSSGSSNGSDELTERVIAVRDGGTELDYDMSAGTTAEDRARQWVFPARVFRASDGSLRLLNRDALEARLEQWLKAGGGDRSLCGRWIFTWNAFQIECDPDEALQDIATFDLTSQDLRENAPYRDAHALAPGALSRIADGPNGATFVATMQTDPDAVRRERAEADVVIGEIMRKPVTLETTLAERSKEQVDGTILVTFEADAAGDPRKRTRVMKLNIKRPDGISEDRISTETVERRLVP